jgi:hypothetical protein
VVTRIDFQERVLRKILEAGRRRARRYLLGRGRRGAHTSRQLARELAIVVSSRETGYIYSDPYWSVYFHDGRASIRGKTLVWFRDPKDDPRLQRGRTPNRAANLKRFGQNIPRLSREEFRRGVRSGKIVVRRSVRGTRATPFFSNTGGMAGFAADVDKIVAAEFRSFLRDSLGGDLNIKGEIRLEIRASRR